MDTQWLDRKEYPFTAHYLDIDGHKLHYIDEGSGATVLFVHGTPSWSFDFRQQVKALSAQYRCIAMDHMGFGLSDKPSDYDYSPQRHSEVLERLIVALDLREVHLVVHDFGGPIGLQVALRQPERFKSLTVLNSWMWSSEGDPEFERLARILRSPLLPFLYRWLNFSPRFLLPGSFGKKPLARHLHAQYRGPFAKRQDREGPLAFARALLQDQDWFQSLWEQKERLQHLPMLLIWGMRDRMVGPRNLKRFRKGFPEAEVLELETCGHFPQEEEAEKVTAALQAFLAKWA